MSDIFMPLDTVRYSKLYSSLVRKGIINGFVNDYLDKNRRSLKRKYSNFEDYNKQFIISDDEFDTFTDRAISEEIVFTEEEMLSNSNFVKIQLKALIARNLYEVDDYFEVISPVDPEIY